MATVAYDSNKVFVTLSDSAPDRQVLSIIHMCVLYNTCYTGGHCTNNPEIN